MAVLEITPLCSHEDCEGREECVYRSEMEIKEKKGDLREEVASSGRQGVVWRTVVALVSICVLICQVEGGKYSCVDSSMMMS